MGPPFPCRVLEDEIQQLRSELRETVDENGRLYKLLKERDFEIKHLKKKMEEDRFAFTGNSSMGSRRFTVVHEVSLSLVLGLDATHTYCVLQKEHQFLSERSLQPKCPQQLPC